jgi:hypothetical protein
VKIDSPTARALYPPSGASSTRKMISLIDDLACGLDVIGVEFGKRCKSLIENIPAWAKTAS